MSTASPGPWKQKVLLVNDADGNQVAHCTRWEHGQPLPEVAAANACLIAAAPELFAALTELQRESESFVNLARQRGHDLRPEAADLVRNALASARAALAKAEDAI